MVIQSYMPFVSKDHGIGGFGVIGTFNPQAFDFSLPYCCWIQLKGLENKGNDHQLKKLFFLINSPCLVQKQTYREHYEEYAYWCQAVSKELIAYNWLQSAPQNMSQGA